MTKKNENIEKDKNYQIKKVKKNERYKKSSSFYKFKNLKTKSKTNLLPEDNSIN